MNFHFKANIERVIINRVLKGFVVFILFASYSLTAQINHELKTQPLAPLNDNYSLYYESLLSDRWSVELGLELDLANIYISETNFDSLFSEFHVFSSSRFYTSLGVKYYVLVDEKGSGVFIGPHVRLRYLLGREDGYIDKWEEVFNTMAPDRLVSYSGFRDFWYGAIFGGKYVIKDHFPIEFAVTYARNKELGVGAMDNTIFYIDYYLKFGYRF